MIYDRYATFPGSAGLDKNVEALICCCGVSN